MALIGAARHAYSRKALSGAGRRFGPLSTGADGEAARRLVAFWVAMPY